MRTLKEIITEIKSFGLENLTDDMLLDCAVRIYNTQNMQQKAQAPAPKPIEEPATEKQKNFLRGLSIDFPKNLTKREASKLIEEARREI